MSKSTIERLDVNAKVRKRAQWEALKCTLLGDASIEVRNQSYAGPDVVEHTYQVEIENGEPKSCTCPYTEYHEGDCKHMAAVAFRVDLPEVAVASGKPLVSDGGNVLKKEKSEKDTCPNGSQRCDGPKGDVLPCFPCYMEAER